MPSFSRATEMRSSSRSMGAAHGAGGNPGSSSHSLAARSRSTTGSQASTPVNRPFRDDRSSRISTGSLQPTAGATHRVQRPASTSSTVSSRASAPSLRLPMHRHRSQNQHGNQRRSSTAAVSQAQQRFSTEVERDQDQDETSPDEVNEIIMALELHRTNKTLGCAYYVGVDEALFLQEDIPMADLQMVETMLMRVQPTTVIIPNRSSDELVEFMENHAQDMYNRGGGHARGSYVLRTVAPAQFNHESAEERLAGLDLEHENRQTLIFSAVTDNELDVPMAGYGAGLSKQNRLMRLATIINLDSKFSVACAGAVLSEIDVRKASNFFPDDPDADFAFRVRSISMFMLGDSMFINADALRSLQIMGSESHPNAYMQGPKNSGAKEGLSLYGLFHFLASTPQGKDKLRQLFFRPTMDLGLIQERHQTIAVLLRPDNAEQVGSIRKTLKKITQIRRILAELRRGVIRRTSVRSGIWATLQKFALYAMTLRENVSRIIGRGNVSIITRLIDGIQSRELSAVGEIIAHTIELNDGPPGQQVTVAQGVDPELDEQKRVYNGLDHLLNDVTIKLRLELPQWAHQYVTHCIFYPQLGFLTSVVLGADGRPAYEGEGMEGDLWEKMYTTDNAMFYKNRRMRELDQGVGDVYTMIGDREIEIIHDLGLRVLEHENALLEANDLCGEFDCLVALAVGAEQYNLKAPQMTTDNVLAVRGGRHPLQELVVPSFVPNDCQLVGGRGEDDEDSSAYSRDSEPDGASMLMMTGPNHSGKSVYIKQNALIVYMAHLGSFVPAEKATIGLTDKILTRIATCESVSLSESAFSIDLRQAAFSINFATHKSLVLLDEFGKGTDPISGASLMAALIQQFLHCGPNRPKVLSATHFHEIFENRLVRACPEITFAHMICEIDQDVHAGEPITFLYQLEMGRSSESFGSRCAAMNGVDMAIVEEADRLSEVQMQGGDVEEACCRLFDEELRELQRAEVACRAFLEIEVPDGESQETSKEWLRSILGN